MASTPATIVWFRNDLRLEDHSALQAALQREGPIIPVFIWAPEEEAPWAPGAASRWWLHQSLQSLANRLASLGSRLVLREGPTEKALLELAREGKADAIFWNRRFEPAVIKRDTGIKNRLRQEGWEARSFNGSMLTEPGKILNKTGEPYRVFTPFWKACLASLDPEKPIPAPRKLPPLPRGVSSGPPLEKLALEPTLNWADGFRSFWEPGSAGAAQLLKPFLKDGVEDYSDQRNRTDRPGTSRLSPHLHFGEISPRMVWHALRKHAEKVGWPTNRWKSLTYLTQLGWREFGHHLLFHYPHTDTQPLRPEFQMFPWKTRKDWLTRWQQGKTGYPMVDAGMRQLWQTGWMHNRVRMIVASFLVKNLMIPWQEGARWFWDTLVDANLANNTLGWQWTAGCGADAAPFFRIFNPITQGTRYDPDGSYVSTWIPELKGRSAKTIHQPVEEGVDDFFPGLKEYPEPIISLGISRERALEAYQRLKKD